MTRALCPDIAVNGQSISSAAIAAEAQNHRAPKDKPGLAWRKAARALAVRALLLQEARRRSLEPRPIELEPGKSETEDEAMIRALLEAAIEVAAPSEPEVRAEWERAPERFRSPPLWEVSHILCACEPGDHPAAAETRARADALGAAVLEKPHRFAAFAAAESDCGTKSNGGALGQLVPGDTVPEFEAVLRGLGAGEITPVPVRSRFGWHIVRLDSCADGQALPYETVRRKLSEAMEKAAWAEAAQRFVERLVAEANIVGADIRSL